MIHQIPIHVPIIQTDAMRADQIQSHTIIAQAINVQRLRDKAHTSRNPLDKRDLYAAEDVLHDMLEPLMTDERYRVRPGLFANRLPLADEQWPDPAPSSILTNGGNA